MNWLNFSIFFYLTMSRSQSILFKKTQKLNRDHLFIVIHRTLMNFCVWLAWFWFYGSASLVISLSCDFFHNLSFLSFVWKNILYAFLEVFSLVSSGFSPPFFYFEVCWRWKMWKIQGFWMTKFILLLNFWVFWFHSNLVLE